MNTRSNFILTAVVMALSVPQANAQYREGDNNRCDFGYRGPTSSSYRDVNDYDRGLSPASYNSG